MLAAGRPREGHRMETSCHPTRPAAELPTTSPTASQPLHGPPGRDRGMVCSFQHLHLQAGVRNLLCPWRVAVAKRTDITEGEASRFSSQKPFCSFCSGTSGDRGRHTSLRSPLKSTGSWAQVLRCSWALAWSQLNSHTLVMDIGNH